MEYKINLEELEKYTSAFAEKTCNSFFASAAVITGNQILKFTPSEQVNFFIIQEIFDKWKEETSRLKSPYFDYEHPEVKEALKGFINKLSNFISIRPANFTPLVQKACYNAIWFNFLPDNFISKTFLNKNFVKKEELKEKAKYIKLHKALFAEFIAAIEREPTEEISSVELFRVLNKIYIGYAAEDPMTIVSQLSPVLNFDADKILIKPIKQELAKPVEQPAPIPVVNVVKEELPKPQPVTIELPKQQPVITDLPKQEQVYEKQETGSINNQYTKSQSTLNDLFRDKAPDPAAVAKGKIASIRAAITLNKKYLFVNALFKGSPENFDKAITEIDNAPNEQAARECAENYAKQLGWEKSKEEAKELLELLTRKFL